MQSDTPRSLRPPQSYGVRHLQLRGIADAAAAIKSWPEVQGVTYSNTEWVFDGFHVNYRVTTSNQALAAYKAAGAQSYFL